jgi:hypothetical protein
MDGTNSTMIPPRITLSVQEFDETKAKTERAQSKGAPGLAFCDLGSVQPIPHGNPNLSFVIPRACDLIPIRFKATGIEHVLLRSDCGNQAKVRFYTVPLAVGCSILSVFGARSSVLLVQPGLS